MTISSNRFSLVSIRIAGLAILLTALGVSPARGQTIKVDITSDNAYAPGYGTFTDITSGFLGIVENLLAADIYSCNPNGVEHYMIPHQTGNYLYIVTWSDDQTLQGLLAQFQEDSNPKVYSGVDPGHGGFWEVCATGIDYDTPTGGPAGLRRKRGDQEVQPWDRWHGNEPGLAPDYANQLYSGESRLRKRERR